jgi:hypothetical protein
MQCGKQRLAQVHWFGVKADWLTVKVIDACDESL